ncbi:receptor-like serine/threonine-protein kinase SD1-8 [Herrania umbratica]|uniref:non-specific serine/threonine protein kinase n=1 Tax=Herrania umbratica TaxID=108875 RepID=A0A6J1BJJ2_9ROSI|nr:receptor-like serine/threonine-protein kinase SD1-8 [Herrania umbratica]
MKMGWNLLTGVNRYFTAWKDLNDPAPGDFTYRVDNNGLPQLVLREGMKKRFRTGSWNGIGFSGVGMQQNTVLNPIFVDTAEELYYKFEVKDTSVITRFTVNQSGLLQRLVLFGNSTEWTVMYTVQNDLCDDYAKCGPNGICRINKRPICDCLTGFHPRSQHQWQVLNWTGGCVRMTPLDCQKGEGFVKLANVKLPDMLEFKFNRSMNLEDCRAKCLENCSCTAYANSDISNGGSGCLMWFGDLVDMREFIDGDSEQDIYIRMPASELSKESTGESSWKSKKTMLALAASTIFVLLASFLAWYTIWKNKRKRRGSATGREDLELPFFDFATIASATNNFSNSNKIGEGGFGLVYKGELLKGQEVAVKRLSGNSQQGVEEFKNEVATIAKLQHKNLVRLLGCCIEGDERMLIYEFMPNKSLDCFIFDQIKRVMLTWPKRFQIIVGIARGLLYLHHDSRLRIIHRDLKSSNILLDNELNPNISDFGIAKMFKADQFEAKTKRVVGTYGYMSPEYAIDGKFSMKSDVFSFGVLLLEIISGKRNRGFNHPDHYHNLLGHAWLLWNDGNGLELMDPCLEDSCVEAQVLRCIQVGLLCVQKHSENRPVMSSVVLMLNNDEVTLPQPKEPGFFSERSSCDTNTLALYGTSSTENLVTITMLEAR